MNIKALYDQVLKAEAARNLIAQDVVRLNDEGKYDEALVLTPKLESANKAWKDSNALYLSMLEISSNQSQGQGVNQRFVPAGGDPEPQPLTDLRASPEYKRLWLDALRHGVTPKSIENGQHSAEKYGLLMNAISTTGGSPAGSEGGFTNPVDVDGRIIELMREYVDLAQYVTSEPVGTNTGWRVIETLAAALPLTPLVELAVLADGDEGESPTFTKISYTIVDYGDFLRVANSTLQDSDENLINYLSRWFAKKVVLTHNSLILTKINAVSPVAVTDYLTTLGAIKTALNKTLDPAFSASANIFTNQSGLDVMDQLDDGTGRPLLQPDPSLATAFRVKGRPVVVLSDAHWANVSTPDRARIAIGDGREFAYLFNRTGFQFDVTNIGGSAWRSNSSEVRGIARMDVEVADADAMVLLRVTLP